MCFKAQQRVTTGEEPFYELANSEIYTDATFPPSSTEQLYYAEDSAFYRTEDSTAARWLRIHNETNNGNAPILWGHDGPQFTDVDQGAIDDSWFMAAL